MSYPWSTYFLDNLNKLIAALNSQRDRRRCGRIEGKGTVQTNAYRHHDIMPDGEHFVMIFPESQADSDGPVRPQLNIVLNWFEELKERVPVP